MFRKNSVGINNIIQHKINGYIVDNINKNELPSIVNDESNYKISKKAIEYVNKNNDMNSILKLESELYK